MKTSKIPVKRSQREKETNNEKNQESSSVEQQTDEDKRNFIDTDENKIEIAGKILISIRKLEKSCFDNIFSAEIC